jgi:hypothetical protein
MGQEQYKDLISPNWKWSIFHKKISGNLKVVAATSGVMLVLIFLCLGANSVTTIDFRKEQAAEPESKVDFSQEVSNYLAVPVAAVSLPAAEFAEKYYSEDDLEKLEDTIIADLNTTGKISLDHTEIGIKDYASRAQDPDFMQINVTDDIVVFTAITFSQKSNRMGRFIAIARKLDKWRLAVVRTPSSSKNNHSLFALKDTSEKIYNTIGR